MKIIFWGSGKKFLIIGLLFGISLFFACKKTGNSTRVQEQPISESVYASGIIKAVNQYEVFVSASGIIKKVLLTENDTVKQGTPLFIIDNAISVFNADNARINMELSKEQTGSSSNTLRELEGRLKLAREKMVNDSVLYSRQINLWEQKVGSKLELEKRELEYKSSQTNYESTLLQYNQLKSDLEKKYRQSINTFEISKKQESDLTIKSNIDGIIYDILKEPGEFVTTQTPIAIIGSANQFEIELQVDEFDIVKIQKDQRVFISMDSYRNQVFEGKISLVEPIMNPRTRTFTVDAVFVKAPPVLYPNLTVEANVLIRKKERALTIPASYLIGNDRVLTSPEETTFVKVGISNMQWVEILDGLHKESEIFLPGK